MSSLRYNTHHPFPPTPTATPEAGRITTSAPSSLSMVSNGWQLPPNTPSPPPPCCSPFLNNPYQPSPFYTSSSANYSTRSRKLRPKSLHTSAMSVTGQSRDGLNKRQSQDPVPAGTGLGGNVESDMQWMELERALGMIDEEVADLLRRRIRNMQSLAERQARAETQNRIARLEDSLVEAHQTIKRLTKEKSIMEDEMKEVEERVVAEYRLSVKGQERNRPPGLRPLGLSSKARPASIIVEDAAQANKNRWSVSKASEDERRTSRLLNLPYRSSTVPAPTPSSARCPDTPPSSSSADSSSSSDSSSPCTPTHSPIHKPRQSYRISQTFTGLSSYSVNAHAYEELELLVDSPPKSTFESKSMSLNMASSDDKGELVAARVRRGRPQTVYGWAPPTPSEDVSTGLNLGDATCPITSTYNKLVGTSAPNPASSHGRKARLRESLPPTMEEAIPIQGQTTTSFRAERRSLIEPRSSMTYKARKRSSVALDDPHVPESGETQPSLLEGYRQTQRRTRRKTQLITSPSSPLPLMPSSPTAARPIAPRPHKRQQQQGQLKLYETSPVNMNNPRQMTALLGGIAKASGWMTVVGFAGLTVGGWMKK
ncbi:hypothetical protein B9479_002755 [Cryptococcus floricola]|uniref:Uncharacterized protein n=1 Tax=Cryptococcus floricola TaxID=2591691 RepID=A0A5D3B0A9_9TREE|nr:hypothetical protein B9479_002755 [Cryptococcus floricola]